MAAIIENQNLAFTLKRFKHMTEKVDSFLSIQDDVATSLRSVTKTIYDHLKEYERQHNIPDCQALPCLIIENFDDEQVWQQLDLQNNPSVEKSITDLSHIVTNKNISFNKEQRNFNILPNDNEFRDKTAKEKSTRKNINKDISSTLKTSSSKIDSPFKLSKYKVNKNVKQAVLESDESDISDNEVSFKLTNVSNEDISDSCASDVENQANLEDNLSDAELTNIKQRLSAVENEDISDDDLNFDFENIDDVKDDEENETDESDSESKTDEDRTKKVRLKSKPSVVDDDFFKLSEMEMFLDQQDELEEINENDNKQDDNDDDYINAYEDLDSDDEHEVKSARILKYEDYFLSDNKPTKNKSIKSKKQQKSDVASSGSDADTTNEDVEDNFNQNDEETNSVGNEDAESDESEGEDITDILGGGPKSEIKSTFEKRQEKLQEKIKDLEEVSLSQKPWQLSGETSAHKRPQNSLLEEQLQFEHTTRLPPVITEETTESLESIIKKRIKDKSWDDVERKVKLDQTVTEYKKRITLDQEKSKQSLGEIYEQEFLKQQQTEEKEKKDPDHEKIKKSMRELFIKLDALSNFHFTPKPAIPDLVIISNQPSINMEEVAPVSVSDRQLLAPEEIHIKRKGDMKSGTEKTKEDKKRDRRNKKTEKRAKIKEKEKRKKLVEKLKPGLGNKYSKEKAMRELERQSKGDKSVTLIKSKSKKSLSSKIFFAQLQEETAIQVGKRKSTNADSRSKKNAKKLKL